MEENEKKSIKKGLTSVVIGVVVFGAAVTGACYSVKLNKENNFKRITTESGEYDLDNSISYDNLKKYSVVKVQTIIGENKLFIAELKDQTKVSGSVNEFANVGDVTHCNDIMTGENLIEGYYTKIVDYQPIGDYLVAYDMIKAKYSKEDIETLLENIKEDYQKVKEKTLVKE